jgi:MoxR-like ATPase
MKTAQALAMFDNMVFVTPEHVQELAVPVLSHRLALDPQARFAGQTQEEVIVNIIKTLPVPV